MAVLAGIIILGIMAQWIAWRTKLPSILPLILIGLFVGPISTLFTADGCKLIQPMFEGTTQCANYLFPGDYLFYFVSLSISLILFEGGLTLKQNEIKGVGPVILKLISLGSVITFIGGGLAAHYVMGLTWTISFLFAALIIVTGPTVIAPILQNVPLKRNVSTVLKWEGILIDPIGALVAVLVFEFIISGGGGTFEISTHVIKTFLTIILIGLALGSIAAFALAQMIKRELIPHYLHNVFTLATVLGVFVLSDELAHESGLLSVVVMGMVLGNMDLPGLRDILNFKESITVLLISILFILLSANINISDLMLLMDWRCLLLFGLIVFLIRPLGVFLSTKGSEMSFNEKLFVSWVGPRGIVAAGIASLFGIKLMQLDVAGASYITPLVFMVVLGTVVLNATTARMVAKVLGVIMANSDGVLFIGANKLSILIAGYLHNEGRHVVMIDNNGTSVEKAKENGLIAYQGNIFTDDFNEDFELLDMGYLMAMTGNAEVNEFACKKFEGTLGEQGTYRLISAEELKNESDVISEQGLFSIKDDFINLMEIVREYPEMHELNIKSESHFHEIIGMMNQHLTAAPVFIKTSDGEIKIVPANTTDFEVGKNIQLIYIGKALDLEKTKGSDNVIDFKKNRGDVANR